METGLGSDSFSVRYHTPIIMSFHLFAKQLALSMVSQIGLLLSSSWENMRQTLFQS